MTLGRGIEDLAPRKGLAKTTGPGQERVDLGDQIQGTERTMQVDTAIQEKGSNQNSDTTTPPTMLFLIFINFFPCYYTPFTNETSFQNKSVMVKCHCLTAYIRMGLKMSLLRCLSVFRLFSNLVRAFLMALVFLGRRSRGLYFLLRYSFRKFSR